ncbi:MAG: amino acid permease [Chlorobi bacterium]|nr:amino acid permease [Chlorobiota bacterium]
MAQKVKKFGAFDGVFTPSILTILGVIMYLRLGWVTGVAGLWGVVAIILLSHVISLTTGLSISSIATDKRIHAGGIYYILSRSLGLPIGGSIGITLFVGTALSISMYIVGFTENFTALPVIQEYLSLGSEISLNEMRVVGSIVLVVLVILALISTNIAIKTQFLILGAIFLSLVSIVAGYFNLHPVDHQAAGYVPPFTHYSFEVVFAIFFPAVTGFTAGVAMSGDLKNPVRDIPKGTLWAIFTGLVVYLGLAVSFYFLVDQQILINNYNFLMTIAFVPFLVILGIWGATLSSALGGILGAPRIIQAVAKDRIVPRILAKGQGVNNEPRNALLFTFFISLLGVLIGDLNIIAGLVTIFYLTAYGFINLAFALEKWASTDFRPSFKVSLWVGIIGFLACFLIMFKLDFPAMILALVILTLLYVYISRRNLHLPMGDVWPSVNANLLRKLLTSQSKREVSERNWIANILLFSGGSSTRPHLIHFAKWLAGSHGMISNFDLVENKSAEALFPGIAKAVERDELAKEEGIFSRKQECRNIYEAIESISASYGFAGVEPNTVLMGWGRRTRDPIRFTKMLRYLTELDLNIVLLDYNREKGFGNYQQIDLWWRGGSNNGNFVLSLIKFIWSSIEWHNATVRLLIINHEDKKKKKIKEQARRVLNNMRMNVAIIVLNNEKQKKPVNQIIRENSKNSDLIFLGIPDIVAGHEKEFIARTDEIYKGLGTKVLVKASSFFSVLHIGT